MQSRAMSPTSLQKWHSWMFKSVVPVPYYAGNFRQRSLKYPCLYMDVQVGPHLGVAPDYVKEAVDQLCRTLESEIESLNPINPLNIAKLIAKVVGGFICIHPFLNGNGRTSRLIWRVILARLGLPPQLSLVHRPREPYGTVMAAAMQGDWAPLAAYVLLALATNPPTAA